MFYAVTQMASKGVVSMEELRRQLGEKLPNAMQVAAKGLNTTPELLEAAIRKGMVNSVKFIDAFGSSLIRTFADSSEKASESVSASLNRLTNVWVDFVKQVLDSGAGQSIVQLFDALREKLSDPYVMERFAQLIKSVADQFTAFVTSLTKDDLRNGFDTLVNGIQILINVLGKFISMMTWIINNAAKAGAIMGTIAGVATGAVIGTAVGGPGVGTVAGAVIGGAGAGYAGYRGGKAVEPNEAQRQSRAEAESLAQLKAQTELERQTQYKFGLVIPLLQQFKGLKSLDGLPNLMKPDRLNDATVAGLAKILTDKQYKTDASRLDALKWLDKSGEVLGPNTMQLKDALQAPKKKPGPSAEERSLDATKMRAYGFDANFLKEQANLNTLFKQGKISVEQYDEAYGHLLAKQPFFEENLRKEKKELESNNKQYELFLDQLIQQIEMREKLGDKMADDLRMAEMRTEEAKIETQVVAELNRFRDKHIQLTDKEIEQMREKFRLIEDTRTVSAAEDAVLKATVDKWKSQIDMIRGIEKALKDPSSGLTKQMATDYIVGQDKNTEGSQQWMDAQRRSTEEYYSWVDGLRKKDLISEQTAQMMKAKAGIEMDSMRIKYASDFFGQLASLSSSSNKKIAQVGKAAAVVQATMDGYVAVQKALASAPPPYNYALAAAVGVAAAANVAKIMGVGFMEGGYTGNTGKSQVAGVVHGQEFVVNAAATARNRATLEAINAGRPAPQTSSQPLPPTIIVNNNAPDSQARVVERDTPNGKEIEVLIEKVIVGGIRRGGKISDAIEGQYKLNRAAGTVR
jgi:tape measure domain-containing protein